MNFNEVAFEFAAGRVDQLPESDMPEFKCGKNPLLSINLFREKPLQG